MATDDAQNAAQYTPALEVLVPVLRPIPVIGPWLAGVVGVTIELRRIQFIRAANAEALAEIINRAERLSGSIANSRQTAEERAQTLSPLIEELHEVVKKTKSRADHLLSREMSPSCWETLFPCLRLPDQDKALQSLRKDMDTAFKRFSDEAQMTVLSDVAQIRAIVAGMQRNHQDAQFTDLRTTLNPTDEALYTAHSAPSGCTNGTRQRLLSEIAAYATQSEAQQSVCWISGLAGTGKSAIARSVCERLGAIENIRILSFFLSESSSPLHDPILVLHTLAFHLACTFPKLLPLLCEAIRRNPGALKRPVQEQAKFLLEETISGLAPGSETLVVVLDAVDLLDQGLAGRDDRQLLAALFAFARVAPIRVRIIATGRPTRALRDLFSSMMITDANNPTIRVYKLEDVEAFEVKHDIRTFLRASFAEMSARNPTLSAMRWPPDDDVEAVATRSNGIFLYAAAVVRCLELPGLGGPETCLNGILRGGPAYRSLSAILDNVYSDVLHRVTPRSVPSSLTDQARNLVGSLIIIDPRLPVTEIAYLMGYQPAEVQRILDLFYDVLFDGDQPSIFHPTFSEFIQDNTRCQDPRLVVDISLQHANLASRCLGLVSSLIGNNRGAIAHSRIATLAADLRRLAALRTRSAQLYAFQSWPRHLSHAANVTPELVQALTEFAEVFPKSWIDIMLEFETRASVEAGIQGAAQWCEGHPDLASVAEALRRSLRVDAPAQIFSPIQAVPIASPSPPPISNPSPVQAVPNAAPIPPPISNPNLVQAVPGASPSPPLIPESQSVHSPVSLAQPAPATLLPSSRSNSGDQRVDEERAAAHSPSRNTSVWHSGDEENAPVARTAAVSLHQDSLSALNAPFSHAGSVAGPGDGVAPTVDPGPISGTANDLPHNAGSGHEARPRIGVVFPESRTAVPVNGVSDGGLSHSTS